MSVMEGLRSRARRAGRGRMAMLLLLPAVLLLMVPLLGCGAGGGGGSTAPDFSGTTLGGQSVSLGMYKGKPLILAFTASW